MNKFTDSFKNKKFRYGAFSTLLAAIVIAVLIMIVAVFDNINLRFDLTPDQFFTITDQTRSIINNLDEEVRIYTLIPTGVEQHTIVEILNQYAIHSNNISVNNRDPIIHRAFVDQFITDGRDIPNNSVIVVGERRHQVIPFADLFVMEWDLFMGDVPVALNVEPMVTNAITYVTQDIVYNVFEIDGVGSVPLPQEFVSLLHHAGYHHNTLNLIMEDIPEHADVIILTTPARDLSPLEAEKIIEFLDTGGKAMFAIDIVPQPMPNMHSVIEAFGVVLNGYYVLEGDANRHFPGMNTFVFPHLSDHVINTRNLEVGMVPMVMESQGIWMADLQRQSADIDALLITTPASFGRNDPDNLSPNRMEGEPTGPFALAVAINDTFVTPAQTYETRIVVVGTSNIFNPMANQHMSGANGDFFISSLNWLLNRADAASVFIQPRALTDEHFINITQADQNLIMVVSMGVLPGVIAATGLVVWLLRRNK